MKHFNAFDVVYIVSTQLDCFGVLTGAVNQHLNRFKGTTKIGRNRK